jgi:hypothetical protein
MVKNFTMAEQVSQKTTENASNEEALQVSVKLEGAKELEEAIGKFTTAINESAKPKAILSNTEASQKVEESKEVKEQKRFERISEFIRTMHGFKEDISSSVAAGALGQVWQPDMIVLPLALPANLRRFVQVKEIPKGSKQVNFTTITTVAFGSLTEDTSPADVSQTIAEISIAPTETGSKQRVSYITMESATPDVVEAVERSFQAAALIDEDTQILTATEAANNAKGPVDYPSTAGVVFSGGGSADTIVAYNSSASALSDTSLVAADTFKPSCLAEAFTLIQEQGYALNPGDLVAVLHPVQYQALLENSAISQYLYFGSVGPIQQGVIPQVYGIDLIRSTAVPTSNNGASPAVTTYHAQVFMKTSFKGDQPAALGVGGAVAMGISRDLLVELWRRPDERDLWIIASHRIAVGVLQPLAIAGIHTC